MKNSFVRTSCILCKGIFVLSFTTLHGCGSSDPIKSNEPIIGVSPASLVFTAQVGLGSTQDSLLVSNVGGGSFTFTALPLANWIVIDGQSQSRVFVRVSSANLGVGQFDDSIVISSSEATNSPVYVPIRMTVTERLQLSDTVIQFSGLTGGQNPALQTVTLSAAGSSNVSYEAAWSSSWLIVSPASGLTPQQIDISTNISGLPGGLHVDTVIFTSTQFPQFGGTLIVRLALSSWTVANAPPAVDVQGIMFQNGSVGWAAGFLGSAPGPDGVILKSTDGGLNWSINKSGVGAGLGDINFRDAMNGIAVGDSATILSTIDGGANWNRFPRPNIPTDSGVDLWSITFVNLTTGYIIGTRGTILRTLDGGTSWTPQNSGVAFALGSMSFPTASEGWVVGNAGTILHTTNSGVNWQVQSSGTNLDLWGVGFLDVSNGWIVGAAGVMLSTSDGGLTWEAFDSGVTDLLRSVATVGSTHAWAVSLKGTVLHTSDAGMTWVHQSTGSQGNLFGVHFLDENIGWLTGTGGTILKTLNGGF